MIDFYSDVATFGIISANLRLIFSVVVSIILVIIGIVIIVQPVKRSKMVNGIITATNCITKNTDGSIQQIYYECTFDVKCTINGKEITPNLTQTSSVPYTVNQKINLYYDPNDISDIDTFSDNNSIWGWLLIGIAIFIVLGAAIWTLIVHKSKFAAAIGGGAEGVGIFGGAISTLFGK